MGMSVNQPLHLMPLHRVNDRLRIHIHNFIDLLLLAALLSARILAAMRRRINSGRSEKTDVGSTGYGL